MYVTVYSQGPVIDAPANPKNVVTSPDVSVTDVSLYANPALPAVTVVSSA